VDENFFCQPPRSPFPIPRLSSVALAKEDSPFPQKLGTDPTIANKIKGLRGFGGRVEGGAGAVVQICHSQHYTENSILLV